MRPVPGRDRGADGQRRLDHGDHSRRNPPAGAQRRRRQRQPHPHRLGLHHQRRRRDRPGGGVQRTGAARPGAGEGTQARLHHPAGKHVAHQYRSEDRGVLYRDPRPARGRGIQGLRNSDGAGMPCRRHRRAARQEHVRARHAVPHLQPRAEAGGGSDRARLRQEGQSRRRFEHQAAGSRVQMGGSQSRLLLHHPGQAPDRTANRRSTAIRRWRWG